MKIVVLDGYALNPGDLSWDFLKEFGPVEVYDRTEEKDIIPRIGDAQIVLVNKTPVTAATLQACPSIRLICVLATGYNVVDTQAAWEKHIPVCNVPDYGTNAVAQFTFALLLELCHQVGHHSQAVKAGRWAAQKDFCFWDTPQMELYGKTLGIIGFGRIGQAVGRIAKAFGMEVLAYNRSRCPEGKAIGTYVDLNTLLERSDVVTLHCPLNHDSTAMINADTISMMKDEAILINTARGPLIDQQAVAEALASGKLRAAACDVVSQEPILQDNPLLTAPNCILTPHMAWAPKEMRQAVIDGLADNLESWLDGRRLNRVD